MHVLSLQQTYVQCLWLLFLYVYRCSVCMLYGFPPAWAGSILSLTSQPLFPAVPPKRKMRLACETIIIFASTSAAPDCVRFSCSSPTASASAAACSPIASASAAAPRLHLDLLQLLLPGCVHFSCCSPISSTSAAAPRLHPLQLLLPDCFHFSCCWKVPTEEFAEFEVPVY